MASSFLSPPNRYSLSDAVIGSVVQRAGPLYSRLGFTDESDSRAVQSYTKPRHTFSVGHADSYSPDALLSKRTDKYQPKSLIGQKRLPDLDSLADVATKRPVNMAQVIAEREQEQLPPQPVLRRKMRVSASRRERCRINQARYRKRQRKHAEDLDEGIRKVQEEIENLEAQRQTILRCAPTNESVWVVATEYFRLFRYGYMTPMEVLESPAPSSLASGGNNAKRFQRPEQSHAQLDFLKATMASDVTDGSAGEAFGTGCC
ncbi:hypothetical protein KRP22_006107 [Phytophthora ramorum]|nr:bZIP transcription factor 1 [Phytophthora ramorum]